MSARRKPRSAVLPVVSLIGPGRVGQALARLFVCKKACCLDAVVGRDMTRCKRAVKFIGAGRPSTDLREALAADILFVSVPDDALAALGAGMALPSLSGKIVLHTSGVSGTGTLPRLRRRGAAVGMFHPMAAVPSPEAGRRNLEGAAFALAGPPPIVRRAKRFVRALGGSAVVLKPGASALHHLACVLASNFPVTLWDAAFFLSDMSAARTSRRAHRRGLLALAEGSLRNARALGPGAALTGPVVRGDAGTLTKHTAALRRHAPALLPFYRAMSLQTLDAALRAKRIGVPAARKMRKILS